MISGASRAAAANGRLCCRAPARSPYRCNCARTHLQARLQLLQLIVALLQALGLQRQLRAQALALRLRLVQLSLSGACTHTKGRPSQGHSTP